MHIMSLRVRTVQKKTAAIMSLDACLQRKKEVTHQHRSPQLKAQRFKPHRQGRRTERQAMSKETVRSVSGPDLGRNRSARGAQHGQSEMLAGNQSELL